MLGRTAGLTLAFLMLCVGVVWTLQGLGYIEGSFMTDSRTWATIGPIVAGLGLALGIVVVQGSRNDS
jgi:hypothetical protein